MFGVLEATRVFSSLEGAFLFTHKYYKMKVSKRGITEHDDCQGSIADKMLEQHYQAFSGDCQ